MTGVALHLSPHPDDELIGAPATLMALRDAGYRVVNLACSLGRPTQRERREAELREACQRAGFELRLPAHPVAISAGDDLARAEAELQALASEAIAELAPDVVVSPGPHDRHRGHEVVARAVRGALRQGPGKAPPWWIWGLWGGLALPTLATAFDAGRLEEVLAALAAHEGELRRHDYRRLVRARAEANAMLAPELLFGFGSSIEAGARYAELLTEAVLDDGRWLLGSARWLDPTEPAVEPTGVEVTDWLEAPSLAGRLAPVGG
jgi:LmbE family N-acetylglucosaminyl deacetylase